MTDKEILIKAVNKARDNGYAGAFLSNEQVYEHRYEMLFSVSEDKIWCFPKAFWGEELIHCDDRWNGDTVYKQAWKFHLQQMVVLKNPVSYLEQFLGD